MKKSLLVLTAVAGVVAMLATGCSSTSVDTNRFGAQVVLDMEKVYLIPEIHVGDQYVSGSSQTTTYCGFIRIGDTGKQASGISFGSSVWGGSDAYQRAALYDACIKSNADIIVAPQYVTTTDGNFFKKTVNCTVKGFPGNIRRVKVTTAKALPECPKAAETK